MILLRHLTKEILTTVVGITGILLLVFLSNQFVRYLNIAADGRMAEMALFHLMLLEIPHLLSLLLPLGLFLSVLLVYGQMYADNEMTVLMASGISQIRLLCMTLPSTLAVMFFVSFLTLWLGPTICSYRDQLLAHANAELTLQTLVPGRFHEMDGGKRVFYVEGVSVDHQHLNHIFVAEKDRNDHWSVTAAKKGYQQIDSATHIQYLVAVDGHRYSGIPGNSSYQIIQFSKYGVQLPMPTLMATNDEDAIPTSALLTIALHSENKQAELQWRLSMPLQVPLLALLAIPLSRTKPRQGRYIVLLPSIFIYIVYANLLFVARHWVAQGSVPTFLGMWWIHGLLLFLGLILFISYHRR